MEPDGSEPVSNMDYRHMVWRVTLQSGDVYAIDLTGSQYGWPDPVCPWQECLDQRSMSRDALQIGIREDDCVAPLNLKDFPMTGLPLPHVDNYYSLVRHHFARTLRPYLDKHSAMDMLILSARNFDVAKAVLTEAVKEHVSEATRLADDVWEELLCRSGNRKQV